MGDQKTGCIGEYYAYLYLQHEYPKSELSYGNHSEKGWDIMVKDGEKKIRVQVKTVSGYSKTRGISPIHRGWDQLFVVYLNQNLKPEGFWMMEQDERFKNKFDEKGMIKGLKCPDPKLAKGKSGSKLFKSEENCISDLLKVLEKSSNQ